ncbi:glucans biosynthesis glucosyltransferase MdoH [Paracoccus tegillarcae]|uniref:Glucans biosynthesis glucosyltransferase H n=1 Tax=Paracoccus tegillarcae TaxID=1529068 RepID=A0A2K9EVL5_9RHOB|nr:glucans biosynthesis glucosyltransferase MdoH [Paracoccus tegillarcae]AUH34946.1 glucans biosynthesis glucosyltransferase MdoH [Paracoccus tegillarcae]
MRQTAFEAAVPPLAPVEMPVQDLRRPPVNITRERSAGGQRVIAARILAFGGGALIGIIGGLQMRLVFGDNVTVLQACLLTLFTITFTWVGFSFSSMLAGLFARPLSTPTGPNDARIVVVMPVYHEDPAETAGRLVALARDLYRVGLGNRSEIFVLSDSRRPQSALAETLAISRLRDLSPVPVWYRRRRDNEGRKAGNIAEFLRDWGGRYDQMVVLDADSVVGADTIAAMSARMSADPDLGLIQTMPMLLGGQTIFARLMQFAGRIYGPAIARGVAAWSGDDGNFWGHNAMIRVPAFVESCGLPELPGRPPFGGHILSHDFVEAALMRRSGWKVRLDYDLRQSFEGSPPSLLDNAVRERRWAQGNLQHFKVIGASGLSWVSRAHFVIGIMGFLMSPIWLGMILVGLALTAYVLLSRPEYFPNAYQLFPDWPVFDPVRMLWLFAFAMTLLLLPKVIAVGRACMRPLAKNSGGRGRLIGSALFEILLSALIAPVQMLIQTRQIFDILRGRDSGWEAQVRAGAMPPWRVVLGHHWLHMALGLVTLVILAFMSPGQLIWLSPILAGLILSPAISRWSASPVFGRIARRRGLLATPEELSTPALISAANYQTARIKPEEAETMLLLGSEPALMARHLALLPPDTADVPAAERLSEISAAAKIAAAEDRAQALSFLSETELDALISSSTLLKQWAALTG